MKARSAALSAGAASGESAAIAGERKKPRAARARKSPRANFFMLNLLSETKLVLVESRRGILNTQ
jgi:hypothetical protein